MIQTAGLVLDMPNDEYHAEADHLSSTGLKRLLPEHYGPAPEDPQHLDFGTAFHTKVFGTDEEIVVVDAATWRGKAAEEARAEAHARGAVPILATDAEAIDRMATRLWTHDEASALLRQTGAQREASVFATDVEGQRIKARFDLLAPVAVDLKSTSSNPLSDYDMTKAVVSYGYDTSAAHYLEVAERAGLDVADFALVFVGKRPPHAVRVVVLEPDFIARGRDLCALAKHRHRHGVPDHAGAQLLRLTAPRWAAHPDLAELTGGAA